MIEIYVMILIIDIVFLSNDIYLSVTTALSRLSHTEEHPRRIHTRVVVC